jgi:hypothetical protein
MLGKLFLKSLTLPAFALLFFTSGQAQQVDCTIQVNYESIPTTNKDLLHDFAAEVSNYVNNYTWVSGDEDVKVKCMITIFVKSVIGDDRYSAQAFIGSRRQLYGTEKSTAVVRLFDEAWEFTYVRNRAINHNPYTFNDLTSFLDFYIYVILGYDYDTYGKLSGTPWFQKAADVASLGRSSGQRTWQQTNSGYNRIQLIDELLNQKFQPVRAASYIYHFTGLDSLSTDPIKGMNNILHALDIIGRARKQVDPRNLVIKSFFETKYLELADLFLTYPDASVYTTLRSVDPAHRNTYDEYAGKRK